MMRRITLRLALPVVLAFAMLPTAALAQSQDSQSVAEAARRARAQKKNSDKPAKVITDENLNVKEGDVQSAAAGQLRMPGSPETQAKPAGSAQVAPAAEGPKKASEDEKVAKERAALKAQIKEALTDLDLLHRERTLEQDTYFSNPDYVHDTAGKAKLDALKQQESDKQEELDRLKARLAALPPVQDDSATTPPKP
jgi:chaperonin cofactor prefoldin